MVILRPIALIVVIAAFAHLASAQNGGVRGMVYDRDFDAPLGAAQVMIAETGAKAETSEEGNYVISELPAGTYTLVFSKEGFTRQVKADVVVSPGQLTEVDAWLTGDFTEMEEFIVQDIQFSAGTEAALLELRLESPSLMDSISADLMSQAGAGDAASALRLVSGASIQDGKYAVIRGLPDRYVNSQMNGVRLPTADADKRAVQLDQFPSAAIESIQVSKTFTPDQQGDASGGAVNVVLKKIPEETMFKFSAQTGYNSLVTGNNDFISYKGGGVNFWGISDLDIPSSFDSTVGVSGADAPIDSKWSLSAGGKQELDYGWKIGGFASLFYERDSSFYDDGIDDNYWVDQPGDPMSPQYIQGAPSQDSFKTQLFDVTQGSEEVKWGALGSTGIENEFNTLTLLYMYTRATEDVATLAEDTRGKYYYFPDYAPGDPTSPGNQFRDAAPFIRTQTLEYTERSTQTVQLNGTHQLPIPEFGFKDTFMFKPPEFDWGLSHSSADLFQPDKRQFGEIYWADSYQPGFPPYIPPSINPEVHRPFKPAANFTLGNLQRIWKDIEENSDQYFFDLKFSFEQWSGDEGYLKFGVFGDTVNRHYNQDSFSNFNDNSAQYFAPWEDMWSDEFFNEGHPVTEGKIDVDYDGEQKIDAWYSMIDLPLASYVKIVGGARFEDTQISIINYPESEVNWIPPGSSSTVELNPGDADVTFKQSDVLPSIGLQVDPIETVTLRASYSQTVARQTFKELSPIQQQEYLGGDVFIGNPTLQMSALQNYDLRVDYRPYEGSLISASYFYKDIQDPIEYVQRIVDFAYTTPVNYPEGTLSGYEFEVRQQMGHFWDELEGLMIGGNVTLIDSEVTLPPEEAALFETPNINAPMPSRDMTNAPDYLYNIFFTYDLDRLGLTGTQVGLFYSVRGDALKAGAGQSQGKFVPNIYEKEYGTLNMSLTQKIGDSWSVKFQAKNLLDPAIETAYRSKYIGDDVTKTSYHKGMEFTIAVSAQF